MVVDVCDVLSIDIYISMYIDIPWLIILSNLYTYNKYKVFTYRYFLQRFPELCIFAYATNDDENDNDINNDLSITTSKPKEPIGCIVCKIDPDDEDDTDPNMNMEMNQLYQDEYQQPKLCGYIGMLAVDTSRRRSGIGSALVKRAVRRMETMGCSSVILETEVSNQAAMKLYEERLGFMREEFLVRYYLNNGDAYRLKLWLKWWSDEVVDDG